MGMGALVVLLSSIQQQGYKERSPNCLIYAAQGITQSESYNLQKYGRELYNSMPATENLLEDKHGNLVIKVKGAGYVFVSRDSEIMRPVLLHRELAALCQKVGPRELNTFSQLSPIGAQSLQAMFKAQHSKYNLTNDTAFAVSCDFGCDVRIDDTSFRKAVGPSSPDGPETVSRRDFIGTLAQRGLKPVDVVNEATQSMADPIAQCQTVISRALSRADRLELERRGIEAFDAWSRNTLRAVDDQVYGALLNRPEWSNNFRPRTAHTASELRQMDPSYFDNLDREIRANFMTFGFKSEDEASASLAKSNVDFHFSFTVSFGVQGRQTLVKVNVP